MGGRCGRLSEPLIAVMGVMGCDGGGAFVDGGCAFGAAVDSRLRGNDGKRAGMMGDEQEWRGLWCDSVAGGFVAFVDEGLVV